jgi:hypothetical protein
MVLVFLGFFSVLQSGAGHALAEAAFLEKRLLQREQLAVQEIIGLVNADFVDDLGFLVGEQGLVIAAGRQEAVAGRGPLLWVLLGIMGGMRIMGANAILRNTVSNNSHTSHNSHR